MKPMGRKKQVHGVAKHHPKWFGKNLNGWWENIVYLCKKRDRFMAKMEIKKEQAQ